METLNAELPAGVRVFVGTDPALPLRAWYVSVAPGDDSGRVEVLISDDPEDRRETVSSFAADTGACVVINGGYFSMERTPALHAGLLVVDGVIEAPATAIGRARRSPLHDRSCGYRRVVVGLRRRLGDEPGRRFAGLAGATFTSARYGGGTSADNDNAVVG